VFAKHAAYAMFFSDVENSGFLGVSAVFSVAMFLLPKTLDNFFQLVSTYCCLQMPIYKIQDNREDPSV
jgi:hypothetical protein